jgi:hypothetical protein
MRPSRRSLCWLLAGYAGLCWGSAQAETFRESFDGEAVSWRVETDGKTVRPFDHRRQGHLLHEGKGAELLKAETGPGGGEATFVHALPAAKVIDDLRLSVWVKSNQAGLQLKMRLAFPDAIDPETGRPLTAVLAGDRYTTPGEWQELSCSAAHDAVQDALRRTRYRLNQSDLSDQGRYVDQAILWASFTTSPAEIIFDDLRLANVVPAAKPNELLSAEHDIPEPDAPVEFRLSKLQVEREPFFPIVARFYGGAGGTVADFAAAGLNVAWIDDYRDDTLLTQLREAGLWATAIPPRPPDEEGQPLDARTAGLLPFGPETRPILFWHLGDRIKPDEIEDLIDWVNQLRAADAAYGRPVQADVTGSEYAFSRHVDLLAESRHITNTAISYRDYRDWMRSCRTGAFLNTFFWTWIQTEPAGQTIEARSASGNLPVVVEPEQIRQQVYAALQAGCRGLGYWMTEPLSSESPGGEERRLAITRLNMELELLEPLLATGGVGSGAKGEPFAFVPNTPNVGSSGLRTRPSYHQITMTGPKAAETPFAPTDRPAGPAEAVLLETEFGPLLIAVWYGEGAQFCPGQMAAPNVNIVVPGIDETAKGYLLTPTGVKPLNHVRVAGGKKITIPKFDQTAVVLFTSDRAVVEQFRRRTFGLAARCAAVSLDLAKAKRGRVADVYAQLVAMSAGEPDGQATLNRADRMIAEAEVALQRKDYDGARDAADDAMQALRILQRAHWESAVRQFASPLASPHAVCYSTLPDHYRLVAKVGRGVLSSSQEPNKLPSGDFEAEDLLGEGWQHLGHSSEKIATGAFAVALGTPNQQNYALCLSARLQDGMSLTRGAGDEFASLQSPPISVKAGQVLHVSGRVRIDAPIPTRFDGAKLHDSLLGPSSGLRWTQTAGWEPFEMLREVPADGAFTVTMTLQGVGDGDVYFDDLRVVVITPRSQIADQPATRRRTARH